MRYTWLLCIVLVFAVVGTECHTAPSSERGPRRRRPAEKNTGRIASREKTVRSKSSNAEARKDAVECQICIRECLSWKVRRSLKWIWSVQYLPRAGGFACQVLDEDDGDDDDDDDDDGAGVANSTFKEDWGWDVDIEWCRSWCAELLNHDCSTEDPAPEAPRAPADSMPERETSPARKVNMLSRAAHGIWSALDFDRFANPSGGAFRKAAYLPMRVRR